MEDRRIMSLPLLGSPLLFLLIIFIPIFFIMLFINVVEEAFINLGVPPFAASVLVVVSVVGSLINIPIKEYANTRTIEYRPPIQNDIFRLFYPQSRTYDQVFNKTTLAINLGGAVVPLVVCLYIVLRYPGYVFPWCFITIPIAIGICHKVARVVPNVGIAMPTFIPPLTAATLAVLFSSGSDVVSLSYLTGVIGVLVGADVLNLGKISQTNASTISIGGAGTFDGIFLTGVVSVFLGKIVSMI